MATKQFGAETEAGSQHEQKQAGTGLGRSMSRAAESLGEAKDQAVGAYQGVRVRAEEQAEALMGWIRHRPLQSVLIGAAIGYLLGRMARR